MYFGYRSGQVPLPALNPVKKGFRIKRFRRVYRPEKPVAVSLGPHLEGAAMCHPSMTDADMSAAGVCARFGRAPPPADPDILKRFAAFVSAWLNKNLMPLEPDTDVTFATWIEKTNYPAWRKAQLCACVVFNIFANTAWFMCKSFIKDEWYPSFKHCRGINSRSDEFKCAIGPWFKVIEEVLFKLPYFIKKIPVDLRPQYIYDKLYLQGAKYLVSDYTSFEALFTDELMIACEFQLYKYMTSKIPGHKDFYRMLDEVLAADNKCKYRDFIAELRATRMSGEMCTSLGNGFSNLMFILFICSELGSTVDGVVEGDDGLFVINGPIPKESDFERLGLRVKLAVHDRLSDASFCGLLFDERDLINVTDPRKELATFGLGTAKYMSAKPSTLKSLLRCKALSLVHQYRGCPILQELGLYGLRVTQGIDHRSYMNSRHIDMWHRDKLIEASKCLKNISSVIKTPPLNTRLLVERLFNITVAEQLEIEDYLRNKNDLSPIRLNLEMPRDWEISFANFSQIEDVSDPMNIHFDLPRDKVKARLWENVFETPTNERV